MGTNCDVITKIDLFLYEIKVHVLCKNNSVRKIVNDRLSKTFVRAPLYGTVWVDRHSPFVVSGVAICVGTHFLCPMELMFFGWQVSRSASVQYFADVNQFPHGFRFGRCQLTN